MVTLRPATPQDAPRLLAIWESAVDATHDFLTPSDRQAIAEQVHALLPQAPAIVAVDAADTPLGFMILGDGCLQALFIDAQHRGAGVGRRLVEHALALYPELRTDVNEQNTQARGFYERLGFRLAGRSETDDEGRPYPLLHLRHHAQRTKTA